MILVDTSVWIDHLRHSNEMLVEILGQSRVVTHPLILAELALGSLASRQQVLAHLSDLPGLASVHHDELIAFIEGQTLYGRGIGVLDAHLLAAVRIAPGALLWTADRNLAAVAAEMGLSAPWS